ncbi:MAG: aminoglycoside phosphotransferase family protein, partial [Anaerolineales bacterium]|nr:aminoglycoside phosphotransferase family protein [Anaerolineales bacterium]
LSYNFVAFAKRENVTLSEAKGLTPSSVTSQDVVLKIGVPNNELKSEMAALGLFDGNGVCQLLDCDEERGFFLLERLKPGTMLAELKDDDERTHIAVDAMSRLWRPLEFGSLLPSVHQQAAELQNGILQRFIRLSDWFDGLKNIRPHFNGGTGPFPRELLERVESFLPELFADENVKLMHGDFHHFNILLSERGWLAIDPKGVVGPVMYDIGPLMLNPRRSHTDWSRFKLQTERRIRILSERLGWEREKIIKWATAHAVLSAWWDFQDGMDWQYSINCARIFSEIK